MIDLWKTPKKNIAIVTRGEVAAAIEGDERTK